MSEFAHSRGEFKRGWKNDETRRRDLIQQLVAVIVARVRCWLAACALQTDYDAVDRVYHLHEYLQPYPLCAATCVQLAHKWRIAHHLDYLPMEYVFEAGDEHSDQLGKWIREDCGKHPMFRPKVSGERPQTSRSDPDVPLTPLQVGDFVAYEVGKFYKILDGDEDKLFQRFRSSFLLVGNIEHTWGALSETAIRTELNVRGVERRS